VESKRESRFPETGWPREYHRTSAYLNRRRVQGEITTMAKGQNHRHAAEPLLSEDFIAAVR
jgi:hypothetical protein